MDNKIRVSPSPHVHGDKSVESLMYGVILALMPAFAVSIYYFGFGAIIITLIAVASCLLFEFLIQKFILKVKPTIADGSAIITGILLAFNVPSNLPVWIVIMGSFVAIAIAKLTFGGLGKNPFNPALVGRVFLLISFPVKMTSWPVASGFATKYIDAITGPTPLGIMKEGLKNGESMDALINQIPSHMEMFMGQMSGSLGEIAGLALVLGFLYLLFKKIITWHIPVSIVLTIAIFTGILWLIDPASNADPLFHILTGGVLLGAIFMATDYVTSPMTPLGMIIFGIGIGLITIIIRVYGAYPEGVSFAILIMNGFVPLINKYIKPKRFGEKIAA
ncbi:MAG: RnfABCDGE type electron transport complex subunit D [Bacteroidales bacterium]|nr:RnfABCDGE type electron transport complex subunit D [Bacteroidales bacterium]